MQTHRDRTFDWKPRHDPLSRDYPVRTLIADALVRVPPTRRVWTPGPILDQGREGACVGHAWVNEATATPVAVDLSRAYLPGQQSDAYGSAWPHDPQQLAFAVYHQAQRVDAWEGEQYSGTSVLAGAKVMRSLGLLHEFRWCFSAREVADTILTYGPVVLGIPWYESLYEPVGGEVVVGGQMVGGHAILACGFDSMKEVNGRPPREMVQVFNSWGPSWGEDGTAWISLDDLAYLLEQQGEAAVPVKRSYGRESTLRRLWNKLLGR